MNWPQIHLALNHFPVIGLLLAVLFWAVALLRKDRQLQALCLWFLVLIGLCTLPMLVSGDPAAEVIKKYPGIARDFLNAHDEVGEQSITLALGLSFVALAGLFGWRGGKEYPRWFLSAVLVLTVLNAAMISYTAYLGGRIHHQELTGPPAPRSNEEDP